MNDSYECTVLVPHKDTLFLLSKAQKSIILEYNKTHQKENYLLPSYPLWGKLDEQVFKVQNKIKITDASLTGPFVEKTKAFFYFKVSTKDKRYTFKILFAESKNNIDCELLKIKELPASPKSFRLGQAVFTNSTWELHDDIWITA